MANKSSRSTLVFNKSNPGYKEYEIKQSANFNIAAVGGNSYAHSHVGNAVEGREKEKRDMQDLNERLANYIEKVRFLEAQNKRLNNELKTLKDRWGKESEKVRNLYEVEMNQLHKLLDEAEGARSDLSPRINKLDQQLHEYLQAIDEGNSQHSMDIEMIDRLNKQLSDCEGEIGLLRRGVAMLEEERGRRKTKISRLRDTIKRNRIDLDQETMNHIAAENEIQSLKDEIEFMKESHENEMKELAELAYRDTTAENRNFWKSEMATSLREMQHEYENKMDTIKGEMESHYSVKIQEVRSSMPKEGVESVHLKEENTRLRTQLNNVRSKCPDLEAKNAHLERLYEELRREMDRQNKDFEVDREKLKSDLNSIQDELDAILKELHNVTDMKLSLELEIAAYRKLLEGEESRAGLRSMMEQTIMKSSMFSDSVVAKSAGKVQMSNQIRGEIKAKTSHQKTAKGNVAINEISADGKYIVLENTGKKDEDISGFRLIRDIDNGRSRVEYEFPTPTILKPDGSERFVKIWSRGNKPAGSRDLECQNTNWGSGNAIFTALINRTGEERATHTQKTDYQN